MKKQIPISLYLPNPDNEHSLPHPYPSAFFEFPDGERFLVSTQGGLMESGKMELQYSAVSLFSLSQELRVIFSQKMNDKGLEFDVAVNETVPRIPIIFNDFISN